MNTATQNIIFLNGKKSSSARNFKPKWYNHMFKFNRLQEEVEVGER